jgi:hypothetical protein
VQTAKSLLRGAVKNFPAVWDQMLPDVRLAYLGRMHRSLGYTPFKALTGRNIVLEQNNHYAKGPLPQSVRFLSRDLLPAESATASSSRSLRPWEKLFLEEHSKEIAKMDDNLRAQLNKLARDSCNRLREAYNYRRIQKSVRPIKSGDHVLIFLDLAPGLKAFQCKMDGPYLVVGITPSDSLVLRGEGSATFTRGRNECILYFTLAAALKELDY